MSAGTSPTLSHLLQTSITGFLVCLNISAISLSEGVTPAFTSVINTITSAISIASSACLLICFNIISSDSGSIPPVSIILNFVFLHSQSAYILSLVTPGVSFIIAIFSPASTLKRVDLPTFGRPTIATVFLAISPPFFINIYILTFLCQNVKKL